MQINNQRYIQNSYQDYDDQKINIQTLKEECVKVFNDQIAYFNCNNKPNSTLAICSKQSESSFEYDMYNGAGGNIFLYYQLYQYYKSQNDNDNCNLYIENAKQSFFAFHKLEEHNKNLSQKSPLITFYMGPVGFYLIAALKDQDMQQELLYGVPGFLYCLLVLQQNFQYGNLDQQKKKDFSLSIEKDVLEIFQLIWDNGIKAYNQKLDINQYVDKALPENFRLVYEIFNSEYIGGIHGSVGVIYMLLISYKLNSQFLNTQTQELFKKTVESSLTFILNLQQQNGNFPSSIKRKEQYSACQFCHGAPGFVVPFILAMEFFPKLQQNLLESALKAGESLWNLGILKKGYGLWFAEVNYPQQKTKNSHGISGNGYPFLNLYNITKDQKWLYRAYKFCLIRTDNNLMSIINKFQDPDRHKVGISDYPFSLMLGLAGDICFMKDCLQPENSAFPGYEIIKI